MAATLNSGPVVNLGLNPQAKAGPNSKAARAIKDQMPKMSAIDAPSFGEIASVKMKVAMQDNSNHPPLIMEATEENLQYLADAVRYQVANEPVEAKHRRTAPREEGLDDNVSKYNTGRHAGKYRVVLPMGGKKKKVKLINAETPEDANELARIEASKIEAQEHDGADDVVPQDEEPEVEDTMPEVEDTM